LKSSLNFGKCVIKNYKSYKSIINEINYTLLSIKYSFDFYYVLTLYSLVYEISNSSNPTIVWFPN